MKLVKENINENSIVDPAFNRHKSDFSEDFTIEWDVKFPDQTGISAEDSQYEMETGAFTNRYCDKLFKEICFYVTGNDSWEISDWSFAGHSNGWFALLCNGDEDAVTDDDIEKLTELILKYWHNYNKAITIFYEG